MLKRLSLFALLTSLFVLAACSPAADVVETADYSTDGCVTEEIAGFDYFEDKMEVTHTGGFTIEYFSNYKVVTVPQPWEGAETAETYLLVQCGTTAPDGFDDATVIEIPVNNMVAMSTTYLPSMVNLGLLDSLSALDTGLYVTSPEVRALIDAGDLQEVGFGGDVNVETVIDIEPDIVMTYGSGFPDYDAHPKLREAGINVVLNADFTDPSPLGRAEWIKFIAAFFNEDAAATEQFSATVEAYDALKASTADLIDKPTVFANTPFDGTWYMPGGESYVANLFSDAGADYLWQTEPGTGSLFLDFETVFDQANGADIWLDQGFYGSIDDLLAADERFSEFSALQEGNVWNNNLVTNESGGNAYYESAVVAPDKVLADLIAILHPELMPDHEFSYYKPLQ